MSHWNSSEVLTLSLSLLLAAQCVPPRRCAWIIFAIATTIALATRAFSPRRWIKLLCAPAGFLLSSLLIASLTLDFHRGFAGSFSIDPASLRKSTDAALRSIASLSCTLLLCTRSPVQWAAEVPSSSIWRFLADIAVLMERYFHALRSSAQRIHHAQQARLSFASRRCQVRAFALLCSALLGRAEDRSIRLQSAMDARLYNGELLVRAARAPLNVARICWILALPLSVILFGRFS